MDDVHGFLGGCAKSIGSRKNPMSGGTKRWVHVMISHGNTGMMGSRAVLLWRWSANWKKTGEEDEGSKTNEAGAKAYAERPAM